MATVPELVKLCARLEKRPEGVGRGSQDDVSRTTTARGGGKGAEEIRELWKIMAAETATLSMLPTVAVANHIEVDHCMRLVSPF